jgi:transcriptional regulator with XRE-family HTH domain
MTLIMSRLPAATLKVLSRNVMRLRHKAKLTQEQLAEKISVTPRYLQMIEAGTFGLSLNTLIRLRKALGCSWNEILQGLD